MPIVVDEETKIFTINTKNSTYQMQADSYGFLLHLYYGARTDGYMAYLVTYADRSGMCPTMCMTARTRSTCCPRSTPSKARET